MAVNFTFQHPDIVRMVELIKELYDTDTGIAGGYGHIVFDDGNLEDEHIDFCIEDAQESKYADNLSEETRLKSIEVLKAMRVLDYKMREVAYNDFWRQH